MPTDALSAPMRSFPPAPDQLAALVHDGELAALQGKLLAKRTVLDRERRAYDEIVETFVRQVVSELLLLRSFRREFPLRELDRVLSLANRHVEDIGDVRAIEAVQQFIRHYGLRKEQP